MKTPFATLLRRRRVAGPSLVALAAAAAVVASAPGAAALPGAAAAPGASAVPGVAALPGTAGRRGVPAQPGIAAPPGAVAWAVAASDAEIDRALAQARAAGKPVLLYWGARWCPPCNQLKATLFPRADFIALSRQFVAVHVDGDRPGAQRVSQRFGVGGYPTVLVLGADGAELARLPGEVEASQFVAVLRASVAGGRPLKAVRDDALAGRPLPPAAWRMLTLQAWDNAGPRPDPSLPAQLVRLARAHPEPHGSDARRLWVKALALDAAASTLDAPLQASLDRLVDDAAEGRAQMDLLTHHAGVVARALQSSPGADRAAVAARVDAALQRLQRDAGLSRGDRLDALLARVELARAATRPAAAGAGTSTGAGAGAGAPPLPPALVDEVRTAAAAADREVTDAHERQAVVTTAAHVLARAGLGDDSEALLEANLARSHSPYYLMSQLGALARERGRPAEALAWHARAWERSDGAATRLQWGAAYLRALVELAPHDAPRIESTAARLWDEAARDGAGFSGRSLRSLQRAAAQLQAWNAAGAAAASLARLQRRLDAACARAGSADGQRQACRGLLRPAAAGAVAAAPPT